MKNRIRGENKQKSKTEQSQMKQWKERWKSAVQSIHTYKRQIVQGALVLAAVTTSAVAGNAYVESNIKEVYRISIQGTEVGAVSDPAIVEQFLAVKSEEIKRQYPNMQVAIKLPVYEKHSVRLYNAKAEDEAVLGELAKRIEAKPVGVELKVDGKTVAVVKDRDTAQFILDKMKEDFLANPLSPVQLELKPAQVAILSAAQPATGTATGKVEKVELQSIGFAEKVDLVDVDLKPSQQLNDPVETVKKLQTGDVKPTKYVIQPGDCISCIASKFDISRQVIYANNPHIQNDKLTAGDELDLTVLQPALSIKTQEKVVEAQEIQHPIEYVNDDVMRAGQTEIVQAGKNGLKRVTFLQTKVNGFLMEEELVGEEVLEPPVKAVVKRGTRVVLGEGTGNFVWPVVSARVSSGYGMRWGRLHKGIDLTSGNKSILASDNGRVRFAGWSNDGYGYLVIINHQNGFETWYAHLSKIDTSVGKTVEKGEKIGVMGDTGESDGVHLHFEIRRNGEIENPMKYLNF